MGDLSGGVLRVWVCGGGGLGRERGIEGGREGETMAHDEDYLMNFCSFLFFS